MSAESEGLHIQCLWRFSLQMHSNVISRIFFEHSFISGKIERNESSEEEPRLNRAVMLNNIVNFKLFLTPVF